MLTVSIATGTASSWSDAMTLQMSGWLFYSEDIVFVDRVAILGIAFSLFKTIRVTHLVYSIVVGNIRSVGLHGRCMHRSDSYQIHLHI